MKYQDETLNIETPENVVFGYSLAGIGSRFLAALVDTIFIFIIQVLVMLPVLFFLGIKTVTENLTTWVAALLSLLAFAFFWGYYIIFEMVWSGQTPGKRLVGLRVVQRDGNPVTLSEVLIRNLIRTIDLLPTGYGIGLIIMFIDPQSRRLGDIAAGTLVVHNRKQISLDAIAQTNTQLMGAEMANNKLPQGFPLERLGANELQLIEDYVRRRAGLANRVLLAEQILKKICELTDQRFENISDDADGTLVAIASFISRNKLEKERK